MSMYESRSLISPKFYIRFWYDQIFIYFYISLMKSVVLPFFIMF